MTQKQVFITLGSNDFLDMILKVQETKRKNKLKLYVENGTIKKVKRPPTELKKIFTNNIYIFFYLTQREIQ